jgi:hypothetical protein
MFVYYRCIGKEEAMPDRGNRCSRALGAALACVALLAGCATQTIQQASTFAKAGIDYGTTVGAFLDVYVVTRIDTNSRRLLDVRASKIDAQLAAELPATLDDFDKRALEAVGMTLQVRDNVRLLTMYFEQLDALATSNLPDEGGAALKSLGEAIRDANAVAGGSGTVLTAEQLNYVEKIGKLAVKAAVGAKLREALQRDKETIAWQLSWQEAMLGALVTPVRQEYERELRDFRREKVAGPYADASARLGTAWIDDRRRWAQSHFHVEAFSKAQKAAAHMRAVWEDMIAGQNDVQSIRLILADLKQFTGVVRAFDAAEKKK